MAKRKIWRMIGIITALMAAMTLPASGEDWADYFSIAQETVSSYSDVLSVYENAPAAPAQTRLELLPQDAALSGAAMLQAEEGSPVGNALLLSGDGSARWQLEVMQAGLYELEIDYLARGGNEAMIQRRLTIDGRPPFEEANNLCLYRVFQEEAEVRVNSIGDQVWPKQNEVETWQCVRAVDCQGRYTDPLRFFLSAGTHEIALEYVDQPLVLGRMAFVAPKSYPAYADVAAMYAENGYQPVSGDTLVKLQGEDTL